ncbi:MAG: single-stranded DNA-binding protein [bacterium]
MNGLKMPHLNQVYITGRLTRDPELRYTQSGVPVLNARLASNSFYKGADGEWKQETTFLGLVAWQGLAERCFERLRKGSAVMVSGRLNSSEWQNSEGEKRSTLEVRADRVQFLDRTEEGGGEEEAGESDTVLQGEDAR